MAKVPSKYLELIRAFPLRPIRSEADLERAEAVLHQLLDASTLSVPEQDYLEILGNLVEEYEKKAYPIEPLPPHRMLAMSIDTRGVTQTEVSRATGIPVSTISELISQRRDFNVSHIEKAVRLLWFDPERVRSGTKRRIDFKIGVVVRQNPGRVETADFPCLWARYFRAMILTNSATALSDSDRPQAAF